jgi:molecular chaperone HtpG
MTTDAPEATTLPFKAEVQQVLQILAHSLYTDREIFLRELISNASDALHRAQFELLTNREALDADAELAVRISVDEEAKTITVSDTGIGMTRDELVENLGTIAQSGARALIQSLEAGKRGEATSSASSAWAFTRSSWSPTASPSPRARSSPTPRPPCGRARAAAASA